MLCIADQISAAQTAPVDAPIFSLFAKLGMSKRAATAAATLEAGAERAEAIAWLSAFKLQTPGANGQYKGQIDMHKQARMLLTAHMCNDDVRRLMWPEDEDLDALLAADVLVASFGMVSSPDAGWLRADFWPRFFALVRLPRHQLDLEAETVVLATNEMLLRETLHDKYTRDIVRFYKALAKRFPPAFDEPIRRDLLLLYFVATCLMEKNGLEVLRASYHMGRVMAEYDQILARPGYYSAYGVKNADTAEQVFRAMRELAPNVCEGPSGGPDYGVRLGRVMDTWSNLLAMLEFDLPLRFQDQKTVEIAEMTEAVRGAPPAPPSAESEQPAPEETPATEMTPGAELMPQEQAVQEAGEIEGVVMAPTTPAQARIRASIGSNATAEVCAYHTRGTERRTVIAPCPTECVQARIGSGLQYRLPARATDSAWLRCMQSRAGDATPAQLIMGTIVASVTPRTPMARYTVMIGHGLSAQAAAAIQPVERTADWLDAISGLASMRDAQNAVGNLDEIDALAATCGWAQAPIGERIARFATLYGAPSVAGAFAQNRWARTPATDAAMSQFKQAHPNVHVGTLQVIAAAAMAVTQ